MSIFLRNNILTKSFTFNKKFYLLFNVSNHRNLYSKTKSRIKNDYGKYILWVIPVTTFCLGVWQVERRKQKIEFIKTINEKKNIKPQFLPKINSEEELKNLEFTKFNLTGEFDHDHEIILMPRSNVEYADNPTSNMENYSGGYVITPFNLQDGRRILVNRGWVKRSKLDPRTRQEGQIKGVVTLNGILRLSEKNRGQIRSQSISSHWHKRVHEEIAYQLNTLPILLDADKESTVPGGPIGGQTRLSFRNEHWQYIITWFGLSACTTFMWIRKYIFKKI